MSAFEVRTNTYQLWVSGAISGLNLAYLIANPSGTDIHLRVAHLLAALYFLKDFHVCYLIHHYRVDPNKQ